MTALIDGFKEIKNKGPLKRYISETIEKCNILCHEELELRALIEIKYLLINLEKHIKI